MNVTCTIEDDLANHLPENLLEMILFLASKLAEIPAEHRDSATVNLRAVEEYDVRIVDGTITYKRPETSEEREQRELDAKARQERDAVRRREEFDKLKAEFEPPEEFDDLDDDLPE